MSDLKTTTPPPDPNIHPLINKRWSPRAFAEKMISEDDLMQIFEAARWAASSMNEQPWKYVYAFRGTAGFEQLWNCLAEGNQPWTKDAPVLFVAMARTTFAKNGKPNGTAEHDLGMANAQLVLQAMSMDIYAHWMAGFDKEKVRNLLNLEEDVKPVCMGVLGYQGKVEQLEEPYKSREIQPRKRKALEDFIESL